LDQQDAPNEKSAPKKKATQDATDEKTIEDGVEDLKVDADEEKTE